MNEELDSGHCYYREKPGDMVDGELAIVTVLPSGSWIPRSVEVPPG